MGYSARRGFSNGSMKATGAQRQMEMQQKIAQMQEDMNTKQAEIEATLYTATVGGGAVKAVCTGKKELQELLYEKKQVPEFPNTVERVNSEDGCKVFFADGSWIICRFSGTEPLLRMAAEGESPEQASEYIRIWREALEL